VNFNDARNAGSHLAMASGGPYANHLHFTPRSRQKTMPAPHYLIFNRLDALLDAKQTVSKQ